MENKTISYLNSKWWYRLIKVIYLFTLLAFLLGYPIGIFLSYSPNYDNNASYIKCFNGKEFILSENGMELYYDDLDYFDKEKARELCFSGESLSKTISFFRIGETKQPYELISRYEDRDWLAIIGYSLLSILITSISFEAIRRIFYYVVLGKIKPEK